MAWLILIALITVLLAATRLMGGRDLSRFDVDDPPSELKKGQEEVLEKVRGMNRAARGLRGRERVTVLRRYMDSLSDDLEPASEFQANTGTGPRGEWVMAPGTENTGRRLLYIHGGAWSAGSPKSHRAITDRLSREANAAVFALDYRLMPEHRYLDGLRDCQNAYQWLLKNGPKRPEAATFMAIAGDSAGGNHALVLSAWIRDQGLRAPDAVIALSPSTDLTLTARSLETHIRTDPLLGPAFGRLTRIPRPILWWLVFLAFRRPPCSPLVSPARGDLSGLPPTLIHVSDSEMLLDPARRYALRAQEAGSPVELAVWSGMIHVWHIFAPMLPEGEEAFAHIGAFLRRDDLGSKTARQSESSDEERNSAGRECGALGRI